MYVIDLDQNEKKDFYGRKSLCSQSIIWHTGVPKSPSRRRRTAPGYTIAYTFAKLKTTTIYENYVHI